MRVGRAFGRLPHELRDVPLHWMMWDYFALTGALRVDDLIADRHRIREASLAAMAYHKPPLLNVEEDRLNARVRAYSRHEPEVATTRADVLERARAMHAEMMARGVMADVPPMVS